MTPTIARTAFFVGDIMDTIWVNWIIQLEYYDSFLRKSIEKEEEVLLVA